ncbi:MAG: hypothetical protein V1733_10205 [bacterium]
MKKLSILLFSFLVAFGSLFSQVTTSDRTFGYFNKTEAGFAFGVGSFKTDIYQGVQKSIKNNELVFSLQTINGIQHQGRVGIGVGVGVEKWKKGLFFPVFGHLFYDVKPKDNTFFGSLGLGSSIGTRDSTSFYHKGTGAFIAQVGIGYKMKVFKRLRFYYEVFFKYQAILSSYSNEYNDSISVIVDYKVPNYFLGFRIGISYY